MIVGIEGILAEIIAIEDEENCEGEEGLRQSIVKESKGGEVEHKSWKERRCVDLI